ncbi:GNAT family N-acetyltransferase [Pontibacillus yanchengensis]|nr:GNAT family N-acetyltransferase [Pontibacillus yanchengensis]
MKGMVHLMGVMELHNKKDWIKAFPIMKQLRNQLTQATYLTMMEEMKQNGYRLFAYEEEGDIVALAGVIIDTCFAWGRYVWVHDLVTNEHVRSQGYGRRMLQFIEEWGKEQNCEQVALSSGLEKELAHQFYEHKMGYKRKSYVFRIML